jgi:hypothetical protein
MESRSKGESRTAEQVVAEVDRLMAAATLLENQGRHDEAGALIDEAQNIEDQQWDAAP